MAPASDSRYVLRYFGAEAHVVVRVAVELAACAGQDGCASGQLVLEGKRETALDDLQTGCDFGQNCMPKRLLHDRAKREQVCVFRFSPGHWPT